MKLKVAESGWKWLEPWGGTQSHGVPLETSSRHLSIISIHEVKNILKHLETWNSVELNTRREINEKNERKPKGKLFWRLQLYSCSGGRWLRSAVIITCLVDQKRTPQEKTTRRRICQVPKWTRVVKHVGTKTKKKTNEARKMKTDHLPGQRHKILLSKKPATDSIMKHHEASWSIRIQRLCANRKFEKRVLDFPGSTQPRSAFCSSFPLRRLAWHLPQIAYRMPPQAFRSSIIFVQFRSCETHTPKWPKAGMKSRGDGRFLGSVTNDSMAQNRLWEETCNSAVMRNSSQPKVSYMFPIWFGGSALDIFQCGIWDLTVSQLLWYFNCSLFPHSSIFQQRSNHCVRSHSVLGSLCEARVPARVYRLNKKIFQQSGEEDPLLVHLRHQVLGSPWPKHQTHPNSHKQLLVSMSSSCLRVSISSQHVQHGCNKKIINHLHFATASPSSSKIPLKPNIWPKFQVLQLNVHFWIFHACDCDICDIAALFTF